MLYIKKMKKRDEKVEKIYDYVSQNADSHIKDISSALFIHTVTAQRYLNILLGAKRIIFKIVDNNRYYSVATITDTAQHCGDSA